MTVFGFRIAPTPEALLAAKWGSITTIAANEPAGRRRPPIRDAPDARFIILKAGATRELPLHAVILFLANEAVDTMSAETSSGALYDMTQGDWLEAERKWRSVGELFGASIRSGAFRVSVAPSIERKPCE
jgi:hypothetical protein